MKIRNTFTALALILAAAFLFSACHKEEHGHGHSHDQAAQRPAELKLPDDLREVLKAEMRLIAAGMNDLQGILSVAKLAPADSQRALAIAQKIEESFILNQKLSDEQMQTLDNLLPAAFVRLDGEFHTLAGQLGQALRDNDQAQANSLHQKMQAACQSCHDQYQPK